MTYFYTANFFLPISQWFLYIFFIQDQPSWQSTPHHMTCDVNLVISILAGRSATLGQHENGRHDIGSPEMPPSVYTWI